MMPITNEIYADLSRHFDIQQIMELWQTVSASNSINRFHATFHTDLDEATLDALGSTSPLPLPAPPSDSL
jgi:hypothetical protein